MRGITSQAMVLAATHPESGKVRGNCICKTVMFSLLVDSGCRCQRNVFATKASLGAVKRWLAALAAHTERDATWLHWLFL
jgi:hypothetical protein